MIRIPPKRLPVETLKAIIESFVLREGTDYGDREYSLADKIEQVIGQIQRGKIVVTYDTLTETCNLVTYQEWLEIEKNLEGQGD